MLERKKTEGNTGGWGTRIKTIDADIENMIQHYNKIISELNEKINMLKDKVEFLES